jgi:hypothetical protein
MAQNIEPSRIRNVRQVAGTSTTELMSQDGITKSFEKKITHSNNTPSSPAIGDLWLDTTNTPHVLKRYKDATSLWVNVGASSTITIEQSRSQSATAVPSSKLLDDELTRVFSIETSYYFRGDTEVMDRYIDAIEFTEINVGNLLSSTVDISVNDGAYQALVAGFKVAANTRFKIRITYLTAVTEGVLITRVKKQ